MLNYINDVNVLLTALFVDGMKLNREQICLLMYLINTFAALCLTGVLYVIEWFYVKDIYSRTLLHHLLYFVKLLSKLKCIVYNMCC